MVVVYILMFIHWFDDGSLLSESPVGGPFWPFLYIDLVGYLLGYIFGEMFLSSIFTFLPEWHIILFLIYMD